MDNEKPVLKAQKNVKYNLPKEFLIKGGPGRPKGSFGGRHQALLILDKICAKAKNKKLLEKDLEAEFKASPKRFFRTYIMPLLPKETLVTGNSFTGVKIMIISNGQNKIAEFNEYLESNPEAISR